MPLYHLKPYYCDYFYQSSGTRYTARGGNSTAGAICGAFSVNANAAASSNSNWTRGACLSFKLLFFIVIIFIKVIIQDMLFVVIHQNMDYILDHFVFH